MSHEQSVPIDQQFSIEEAKAIMRGGFGKYEMNW
jgi:hypothetical protein